MKGFDVLPKALVKEEINLWNHERAPGEDIILSTAISLKEICGGGKGIVFSLNTSGPDFSFTPQGPDLKVFLKKSSYAASL